VQCNWEDTQKYSIFLKRTSTNLRPVLLSLVAFQSRVLSWKLHHNTSFSRTSISNFLFSQLDLHLILISIANNFQTFKTQHRPTNYHPETSQLNSSQLLNHDHYLITRKLPSLPSPIKSLSSDIYSPNDENLKFTKQISSPQRPGSDPCRWYSFHIYLFMDLKSTKGLFMLLLVEMSHQQNPQLVFLTFSRSLKVLQFSIVCENKAKVCFIIHS
jgi:hypothetical protein